jgi:hypothetical protein
MDYTQGTEQDKIARAKKNMLLFGMISLGMSFAGLTSAYIISKERVDWLTDFEIPQAFFISLAIIIASSFTFIVAKKCSKKRAELQSNGVINNNVYSRGCLCVFTVSWFFSNYRKWIFFYW